MKKFFFALLILFSIFQAFSTDLYFYKDESFEEIVEEGQPSKEDGWYDLSISNYNWAVKEKEFYDSLLEIVQPELKKLGINVIETTKESSYPFLKLNRTESYDGCIEVSYQTEKFKKEYKFYFKDPEPKDASKFLKAVVLANLENPIVKKEEPPVFLDILKPAEYFGKILQDSEKKLAQSQSIIGLPDSSFVIAQGKSLRKFDVNGNLKEDLSEKIPEAYNSVYSFWNLGSDGKNLLYGNSQSNKIYVFDSFNNVKKISYNFQGQQGYLRFGTNGKPYIVNADTMGILIPKKEEESFHFTLKDPNHSYYTTLDKDGKIWKTCANGEYNDSTGKQLFQFAYYLVYTENGTLDNVVLANFRGGLINFINEDSTFITTCIDSSDKKSYLNKYNSNGFCIWSTEIPANSGQILSYKNGIYYFAKNPDGHITRFIDRNAKVPNEIKNISNANQELIKNPKAYENYLTIANNYKALGGTWLAFENYKKYLEKSSGNGKAIEQKLLCEIELEKTNATKLGEKALEELDEYGIETARPKYQEAMRTIERLKKLSPNDSEISSMYADLKNSFEPDSTVSSKIPSLKVDSIEVNPIFPAKLNVYSKKANGIVYLSNPTKENLTNIKISAFIRKYMDFPSESEFVELKSGASEVPVQIFTQINSSTLSLNEDKTVQMKLTLTWNENGKKQTMTVNRPITIYRKSAMIWEDSAMLSCFISSNDESISDFVFANLDSSKKETFINKNFTKVISLSNALGSIPLNYIADPINPTSEIVGNEFAIDTVRYPAETLSKKGGDCDDMTTLFCSVMESAGVQTGIVTTTGHVFAVFDSGLKENSIFDENKDLKVIRYNKKIWIPIEITILNSGFFASWKKASKECFDENGKSLIEDIKIVSESRNDYPAVEFSCEKVKIGKLSFSEMNKTSKYKIIDSISKSLFALKISSKNVNELNCVAEIYHTIQKDDDAIECLTRAISIDSKNEKAYKNLALLYKIKGDTKNQKFYLSKAKANTNVIASNSSSETRASNSDDEWEE